MVMVRLGNACARAVKDTALALKLSKTARRSSMSSPFVRALDVK
jgi:hypothetical protein